MTKEDAVNFIRDLFTLRTVWIDKGSGKWAVKKRFHPLLRSSFWVLAVIVGAGIYSSLSTPNNSQAAEEPKMVATLPEPEKISPAPPVRKELVIPLNDSEKQRASSKRTEIILPSEANPNADRIIAPSARLKREPVPEPKMPAKRLQAPKITDKSRYSVDVNKSTYTLTLYRDGEIVKEYPVAVGKNPGDKRRVGDNRTPTGRFRVVSIEDASKWTHDFRDGKGKIKGAYGPWFLRLEAKGWKGIGIHGTHDPNSIGTMATEGCIRLSNEDIAELRQYAYKNMPVTIHEY